MQFSCGCPPFRRHRPQKPFRHLSAHSSLLSIKCDNSALSVLSWKSYNSISETRLRIKHIIQTFLWKIEGFSSEKICYSIYEDPDSLRLRSAFEKSHKTSMTFRLPWAGVIFPRRTSSSTSRQTCFAFRKKSSCNKERSRETVIHRTFQIKTSQRFSREQELTCR